MYTFGMNLTHFVQNLTPLCVYKTLEKFQPPVIPHQPSDHPHNLSRDTGHCDVITASGQPVVSMLTCLCLCGRRVALTPDSGQAELTNLSPRQTGQSINPEKQLVVYLHLNAPVGLRQLVPPAAPSPT